MTKEKGEVPTKELSPEVTALRRSVMMFYDLQKLRVGSGNRTVSETVHLADKDQMFMDQTSSGLLDLEKGALKMVKRNLNLFPIWKGWLGAQKGVGPTMGGVILAYVDIKEATTVSKLWAYAGLNVDNGKAVKRQKGVKVNYNPFLKTKMWVLAECMIKANSPWRQFYDNYKTRKQNTMFDVCSNCKGTGIAYKEPCNNCNGTGGPAPWGVSDRHRHVASMRYMIKMFLMGLWTEWRSLEGYEVRPFYAEEYLGKTHSGRPELPPPALPKKAKVVDIEPEVRA